MSQHSVERMASREERAEIREENRVKRGCGHSAGGRVGGEEDDSEDISPQILCTTMRHSLSYGVFEDSLRCATKAHLPHSPLRPIHVFFSQPDRLHYIHDKHYILAAS